jgi:hypothetical protein
MLNPPVDRCMVYKKPTVYHHFFNVSVAQRKFEVSAYTKQYHLRLKMAPLKRVSLAHKSSSSSSWLQNDKVVSQISSFFATEPNNHFSCVLRGEIVNIEGRTENEQTPFLIRTGTTEYAHYIYINSRSMCILLRLTQEGCK